MLFCFAAIFTDCHWDFLFMYFFRGKTNSSKTFSISQILSSLESYIVEVHFSLSLSILLHILHK